MNIFTTQMEKNQILQSLTCHILFIPSQNVIWCNVILMSEKLLLMTYIYIIHRYKKIDIIERILQK